MIGAGSFSCTLAEMKNELCPDPPCVSPCGCHPAPPSHKNSAAITSVTVGTLDFNITKLLIVNAATVGATPDLSLCPRMSVLQGVLSKVLSWAGLCQILCAAGTGLVAVAAVWTVKLLARHAWFTRRLSGFSRPHADSWLIGHLGKVGPTHQGETHTHLSALIMMSYTSGNVQISQ